MDQETIKFLFTLNTLVGAAIAYTYLHLAYSNPEEFGDNENRRLNLPRNLSQEECDAYNKSRPFFSSIPKAYTNRAHARRAILICSLMIIFCVFLLFVCWQKEILTFYKKIAQFRLSQSQMILHQDRPITHAPIRHASS